MQKLSKPYLTDKELNAPIKAVKIKVYGTYTKRSKYSKKEISTEDFEGFVVVPKDYMLGHVKLMVNRMVRKEYKAIRARTYYVDEDVAPEPVEGDFVVRDFMSDIKLEDNELSKKLYKEKQQRLAEKSQAISEGNYMPPEIEDTSAYDSDGLPKVINDPYPVGE